MDPEKTDCVPSLVLVKWTVPLVFCAQKIGGFLIVNNGKFKNESMCAQ